VRLKEAILRTRSVDTRLAVKLATQPEAKSKRTLQYRLWSVNTGKPNCVNVFHRRVHERQDNIDVMNHQVQDDINIQRARRENAHAMHFKKQRVIEEVGKWRARRPLKRSRWPIWQMR